MAELIYLVLKVCPADSNTRRQRRHSAIAAFMTNWSKRSHSSIRCFLVNPRKQTFSYSTLQMLYIVESTGLRSGEFVGHSVGGMKSSTFRSRKATVSRARCMGRRPVERQKPTLGYPEYVWQWLLGKKIVAIVAYAPFTLTPGSINGLQCCQVSKRRLALFTYLVRLCLTR